MNSNLFLLRESVGCIFNLKYTNYLKIFFIDFFFKVNFLWGQKQPTGPKKILPSEKIASEPIRSLLCK